ncbi:MAG: hypothetical protein GY895_11180 [Phycisphaera sp.]|nr:hypothetical protein [Phycisphaera sp.]
MEVRVVLVLASVLATVHATGCTIRRDGGGPSVATTASAPTPRLPDWSDPNAPTAAEITGRGHPVGFAVMDTDGTAMSMTRLTDEGQVELWRPDSIRIDELPLELDASTVSSIEGRIAIVELARTDPIASFDVPPRRAVDGLLFSPNTAADGRLVVVLGSLARFNPGERWLVEAFLEAGWNVLLSSPPVASPHPEYGDTTTISPAVDPALAGRTLAGEIDVAIGAWTLGLAAITSELVRDRGMPEGPTLLIGMSSGGLAVPPVAALLDGIRRVDAAVLMATGVDPPIIVARTSLEDDELRITRRGPRIPDPDLQAFLSSYLAASTLEDEGLWAWFEQRPILVVEAGFDAAIPADSRSELRSRLPKADLWWLPTGHFGLFAAMMNEAGSIVSWADRRCRGDREPESTSNRIE